MSLIIVQSGWKNWKRVYGVLCDRRMNMNIKGKVYRRVVNSINSYGITGVQGRDMGSDLSEEGTEK